MPNDMASFESVGNFQVSTIKVALPHLVSVAKACSTDTCDDVHPQLSDRVQEAFHCPSSQKRGEKLEVSELSVCLPRRLICNPVLMILVYVSKLKSEINSIELRLHTTGHAQPTLCLLPDEIVAFTIAFMIEACEYHSGQIFLTLGYSVQFLNGSAFAR